MAAPRGGVGGDNGETAETDAARSPHSGAEAAAAVKFRLTAPEIPEDDLHKTAADLLDRWLEAPAVWTTFPAGGYELGPAAAGRLKRLGMKPGMPDIMCWFDRRCVGLELKGRRGARSTAQRKMHPKLEAAGVPVYVVRTPEQIIDALVREDFPIKRMIVKAMLARPYVPAERPIEQEGYNGETLHQGPKGRRAAQPAQGAGQA